MAPQRRRCIVAAKESAVKKYVVKLSDEEREQLNTLIHSGKHPARQLMKARILLKADASEAGEGWSDSRDRRGAGDQRRHGCPDPPATGRGRVRGRPDPQAFAEFGQAAHLRRRGRGQTDRLGLFPAAQGPRAVDVAAAGRGGRGTEHRRARQRQHDRADAKKNTSQAAPETAMGHPAGRQRRLRGRHGGCAGGLSPAA